MEKYLLHNQFEYLYSFVYTQFDESINKMILLCRNYGLNDTALEYICGQMLDASGGNLSLFG